jgi:KipI family sensor histidine kinase inhibitor
MTTIDVVAFGDRAWLITTEDLVGAHRLGAAIERAIVDGAAPPGTAETTVGMSTVVVHLEPPSGATTDAGGDADTWRAFLSALPTGPDTTDAGNRRMVAGPVEVPTVFDGPDLEEVAALVGTDVTAVVEQLCGAALQVAFIGFSPGFPYLVGLPEGLARVPRRPSPRTEVPAGSVALAGGFAGIYPQTTPGGWRLVGRTALQLFDPESPPFARLRAGDRVRLTALVGGRTYDPQRDTGHTRRPIETRSQRAVQVVDPGLFTTVQDAGRAGVAGLGVPRAGPCDPDAMRLANRLAGNDDAAAALEITASGPRLWFGSAGHVTVVGPGPEAVEVSVDDRPTVDSAPVPVAAGQTVTVGRVTDGFRAYLAASGGFTIPAVVGSRSSDVLSGLGPGPLRAGDRLPLGPPVRPRGSLLPGTRTDRPTVRVLAGPHPFPPDAIEALVATQWTVSTSSSRIGIRLENASRRLPPGAAIPSTGMVTGAVQVPPDGRPIVLMPDHATVGGYPVVATVIGADLGVLGQLAPGDGLRFLLVDRPAAVAAARRTEEALAARIQGWYPTQPAT